MRLGKIHKIHFIGIGGIGMSGIAEVLLNLGYEVSGSDKSPSDIIHHLAKKSAKIFEELYSEWPVEQHVKMVEKPQ